jgi:hypothetical protein
MSDKVQNIKKGRIKNEKDLNRISFIPILYKYIHLMQIPLSYSNLLNLFKIIPKLKQLNQLLKPNPSTI